MSKGLEALENICNQCEHYQFEKGLRPKKCPFNKNCVFKGRIKKELNMLEELKNRCSKVGITIDDYFKYLIEETIDNEKKLKALEIIKEKNVVITMVKQTQNAKEYNMFVYDFLQIKRVDEEKYKLSPQPLTQEEYYLLKEVLL